MLNNINIIFWFLINLFIRKFDNFNSILQYLLLKIINKKLNNNKIYLTIKINLKSKAQIIIIKVLYKNFNKIKKYYLINKIY